MTGDIGAVATRNCARCGDPFTVTRPHARFCSPRCRVAASREARNSAAVTQPADEAKVVPLRPRQPDPAVTRQAVAGDGESGQLMVRPRCTGCHWRAAQPVPAGEIAHCEACGYGFSTEEPR